MNSRNRVLPLLLAATLLVTGCHFSPWETTTACRDRYADNLARLDAHEPSAPEPFTVAMLSDTHSFLNDMATVVDRINDRDDVSLVLVLGDVTDGGLNSEFEWACDGLSRLKAPTFYALGNHDSLSFGPRIFKDMFGPLDFAFTFAGTRFVIYNDNAYEFKDAPDYGWMAQAAALQPGEVRNHTIGAAHIPPQVDVHDQAEVDELLAFLDQHGFDATVHGHLHHKGGFADVYGHRHLLVDTVDGVNYALMRISATDITYFHCSPHCEEASFSGP